jgi:transposase
VDQITRLFIDTSKTVFQLHGVDAAEKVVVRRKLRRGQMVDFFSRLEPSLIGLEACGASHHWARVLQGLGHQVRLIAPQHVKAYVKRNKNDARDAEAGCEAMSRPTMCFVPVKSPEDQAGLMLMGVRDRLIRARTQLSNAIRGHAAEFGHVATRGLSHLEPLLAKLAADESLPALARDLFAAQAEEFAQLERRIDEAEARLAAWRRGNAACRRLAKIPSIGPVCSALLVLKTPDPAAFTSGRNFAAWIGLTPKDHSTAGRQRLGVITRAGDEALRAALVAAATALIQQVLKGRSKPSPWLAALLKRKPPKLAAVALANKTARIAWKMLRSGADYDPGRQLGLTAEPG